jgi:cysteinyl-tRNA synthetase
MHNGMLRLSGEKMSKSIGNIVRVHDVLSEHSSDAFRLWIYTSHYRSPLLYDQQGLEVAERAALRIRTAIAPRDSASDSPSLAPGEYESRFIAAMDDDMNVPQAMAVVFDLVREINRSADAGVDVVDAQDKLRELTTVLGLTLEEPASKNGDLDESVIQGLLDQRAESRANRDFAAADRVRDELQAMGVAITDSPDGTSWSRI